VLIEQIELNRLTIIGDGGPVTTYLRIVAKDFVLDNDQKTKKNSA
jgi:hypothetical protein